MDRQPRPGVRGAASAIVFTFAYAVLVFGLLLGLRAGLHALSIHLHGGSDEEQPLSIVGTYLTLAIVLVATGVMGLVQRRSILAYGLGDKRWLVSLIKGAGVGLVALSVLVAVLIQTGHLRFALQPQALQASFGFAAIWALGFGGTALLEETMFRGFPLARLSQGLGFPVAAIATSLVFGLVHLGNGDESWLAIGSAVAIALLLALSVRITGSLWWAIGFHAAWDWAESFLFGCPDSGLVAAGRLMTASASGPAWLSGGAAGPEGSALVIVAIAVAGAGLYLTRPQRQRAG